MKVRVILLLALVRTAWADGNAPIAEALFREATDLFKDRKFEEACPKFAESNKLDPQRGTLANLARCHEAEGKKALAWADYSQLLELSKRAGDDPRAEYAQKKIQELEPGLPRIQLTVEEGLQVKEVEIDNVPMGHAVIGTTFPVDPGKHEIRATTVDGTAWSQSFDAPESSVTALTLHKPKEAPPPPPPPPPPPRATRPWQKPVGIAVGATGIGGLVVGTTLAVMVFARKGDVDKNCVGKTCNAEGYDAQKDAWTISGAATVAFIAGTALLAGGAVLFFTAPRAEAKAALRLGPGGAILEGTW
jgi:hypothetical protein